MTGSKECTALFISCILAGFLAGFLFDVCRAFRIGFKLKKAVPFADILFWIAVVVVCYKIIFTAGDGQLRGFCFAGIGGGALVYILCFSKVLGKWMVLSVRSLRAVFMWFICPVKSFFEGVCAKIGGIVQNLQKNRKIFGKKTLEKTEKIV